MSAIIKNIYYKNGETTFLFYVENYPKIFKIQNGDIYTPDNYICGSSKAFINWAIKTWFIDNNIENKMENGVHFLTDEERQSLRGSLGVYFDIPLQTMSKQYESEEVN